MKHSLFNSNDGKLSYYTWDNVEKPIAILQIVHDFFDHASRYDELARFMEDHGLIVVAHDLRGHGYTKPTSLKNSDKSYRHASSSSSSSHTYLRSTSLPILNNNKEFLYTAYTSDYYQPIHKSYSNSTLNEESYFSSLREDEINKNNFGEQTDFPPYPEARTLGYDHGNMFQNSVIDILAIACYCKDKYKDLPLILMGIGYGSLLTQAAMQFDFESLYEEDFDDNGDMKIFKENHTKQQWPITCDSLNSNVKKKPKTKQKQKLKKEKNKYNTKNLPINTNVNTNTIDKNLGNVTFTNNSYGDSNDSDRSNMENSMTGDGTTPVTMKTTTTTTTTLIENCHSPKWKRIFKRKKVNKLNKKLPTQPKKPKSEKEKMENNKKKKREKDGGRKKEPKRKNSQKELDLEKFKRFITLKYSENDTNKKIDGYILCSTNYMKGLLYRMNELYSHFLFLTRSDRHTTNFFFTNLFQTYRLSQKFEKFNSDHPNYPLPINSPEIFEDRETSSNDSTTVTTPTTTTPSSSFSSASASTSTTVNANTTVTEAMAPTSSMSIPKTTATTSTTKTEATTTTTTTLETPTKPVSPYSCHKNKNHTQSFKLSSSSKKKKRNKTKKKHRNRKKRNRPAFITTKSDYYKVKKNKPLGPWYSRNNALLKEIQLDPLCNFCYSSNFYYSLLHSTSRLYKKKNARKINPRIPILILAGENDPLGNYGKGSIRLYKFFKEYNVQNVKLFIYENARHMLLFDRNKMEVYTDILSWINDNVMTLPTTSKAYQ